MKKDVIKPIRSSTEIVVDFETGEVMDVSYKTIDVLVNPDNFALVYAGFWNVLLSNPLSKTDVELLAYLIDNYADGTPFAITDFVKQQVANKSGKSVTSYNKCSMVLVKYKLIVPLTPSGRTYIVNPRYAFKGSSTNRKEMLVKLKQTCPNC